MGNPSSGGLGVINTEAVLCGGHLSTDNDTIWALSLATGMGHCGVWDLFEGYECMGGT